MTTDLPVDQFLARMRELPDIEASQEISFRMETLAAQYAVLSAAMHEAGKVERSHLQREMDVIGHDSNACKAARHEITKRLERASWNKAVRAVLGEEAWALCRQWIAATEAEARTC